MTLDQRLRDRLDFEDVGEDAYGHPAAALRAVLDLHARLHACHVFDDPSGIVAGIYGPGPQTLGEVCPTLRAIAEALGVEMGVTARRSAPPGRPLSATETAEPPSLRHGDGSGGQRASQRLSEPPPPSAT